MKLSDIIKEMQEFIEKEGDKEVNTVNILRDGMSMSVLRLTSVSVCHDGRYSAIEFMG